MDLSIVIPAFNEAALLPQTLPCIVAAFQAQGSTCPSWEIIVCDNNSTDGTAEIAAALGARVTFAPVRQIARARNAGATVAEGAWFLFIDADSFPPPALLADVIALLADASVVGCGSTVRVDGGTWFNKLRMERLNPLFRLFNWGGGAFLLCRAEAFRAIGGFSDDLYAYEEIDFLLRLKRYGRQRSRRFVVLHEHPVITSGRKGELRPASLARLFLSHFAAVLLFGLYYLLPGAWVRWLGARLSAYWYAARR